MAATKKGVSELVSRVMDETSDPADLLDVDKLVQTAVRKFRARVKKEMTARLNEAFEESLKSAMDALAPRIDEYRTQVAKQTSEEFARLIAERKRTEDLVADIAAQVVKRLGPSGAARKKSKLDTDFTFYVRTRFHWGPDDNWTLVESDTPVGISRDLLSFHFGKGSFLYIEKSHVDLFINGNGKLDGFFSRSGDKIRLFPSADCEVSGNNSKVGFINLWSKRQ
jgi:hypothetical protein